MQATGVCLQQFHTCPPPSLREGWLSLFIALPRSNGASVCQQCEGGAERSVTHRQTVRDGEDLHTSTGFQGQSERMNGATR